MGGPGGIKQGSSNNNSEPSARQRTPAYRNKDMVDASDCGHCKYTVEDHFALYCQYCSKWFHTECENISEEKYVVMKE